MSKIRRNYTAEQKADVVRRHIRDTIVDYLKHWCERTEILWKNIGD